MPEVPSVAKHAYNQSVYGYYGELGSPRFGVRFFQTALHVAEINKLTLVAEIPDSEQWPVRELFQRDIDVARVSDGLLPYFKKAEKIKFFNPLTIALLPIDATARILHSVTESITEDPEYIKDDTTKCFEAEGFYRIKTPEGKPQFSKLEWNSDKVKLVAVDGQHRLSALKRLCAEYARNPNDPSLQEVEFKKWTVPVVLLVFPSSTQTYDDRLLTSMRDIFVTINTQAQKPTRSRTILLNDDTVTAICCQELLDYCHRNSSAMIPLLFFDWRAHKEGIRPESPAAFMRIEELEDLHKHYLLGSGEEDQKLRLEAGEEGEQEWRRELFVDDMEEPLDSEDLPKMREQVRRRYREVLMAAVVEILSGFWPIGQYVGFLRGLPARCASDIQKHALSELMFGIHHGPSVLERQIHTEVENLTAECDQKKREIPLIFRELIGPRALFSGFRGFVDSYNAARQTILSWTEAAQTYTKHMNRAFKEGYLNRDSPHLVHVCFDPTKAEGIINYRLGDQEKALGAYCALLACASSEPRAKFVQEMTEWIDRIEATILRGYKREVRPQIKEREPNLSPAQLNEKVAEEAQKRATRHVKRLKKELELDS